MMVMLSSGVRIRGPTTMLSYAQGRSPPHKLRLHMTFPCDAMLVHSRQDKLTPHHSSYKR
jgi:hypothetical protein